MSTHCPLCGRPPSGVLNVFSAGQVAEFFTSRAINREKFERMKAILADMWRTDKVSVMRCEPCQFGYADPFVAGTADFYQLEAPDTPYPRDKWEYRRTLKSLAGTTGETARLLDIGAGKGYFISQLIDRGWSPANLATTEFSPAGRAAIGRLGVACHPVDVRSLDLGDQRFDAISLFQVLEHLDGYDDLFAALSRLAKPGADLFVAVPNGARMDFNEASALQYDSPPNHVSRWTPKSFEVLAQKYGWRLEACELEPEPRMLDEAVYGAVNRFIRQSHVEGSWARMIYAAAAHGAFRGKANKLVKALGMALSPDAWMAAVRVGYAARRRRGVPHALWAHLRRDS